LLEPATALFELASGLLKTGNALFEPAIGLLETGRAAFRPCPKTPRWPKRPQIASLQQAMNPLANRRVNETLTGLGQITLLARDAFASLLRLRMAWHDVLFQIYFIGVKSQTVVLITGAFTGMVLGA